MWKQHPTVPPFLFQNVGTLCYYLTIGIFTLYLKDVKEGFTMTEAESAGLYGTFIALVFLTRFLGSLPADRYMDHRRFIIIGGIMIGIGYCLMSVHSLRMLHLSVLLAVIGNGFFKSKFSTL